MSYKYNTMKKEVEIINVRLPKELTKWLDSLVEGKIYRTRSEAIREFAREYASKKGGEAQ